MKIILTTAGIAMAVGIACDQGTTGAADGIEPESGPAVAAAQAPLAPTFPSGDTAIGTLPDGPEFDRAAITRAYHRWGGPLGDTGWTAQTRLAGRTTQALHLFFQSEGHGHSTAQLQIEPLLATTVTAPDRALRLRFMAIDPARRTLKAQAGTDLTFWLTWDASRTFLTGQIRIADSIRGHAVVRPVRFWRGVAPVPCRSACLGRICDLAKGQCQAVDPATSNVSCTSDAYCPDTFTCALPDEGPYCVPADEDAAI